MGILAVLALIPPAILLYVVYQQDKIEKEPAKLLLKVFLFGCVSTIPAMIMELIGDYIIGSIFGSGLIYLILEYFVVVAMSEEFVKMMAAKLGTWKNPEFNYKFDAIVYCVFSSLGFAALENLLYILPQGISSGISLGITRGLLSIPGHCVFGVIVGYWYGLAKEAQLRGDNKKAKSLLWRSVYMAALAHGFYDFALSTGSYIMILLFYAFVIGMDIWGIKFVKKQSREDAPLPAEGVDPSMAPQQVAGQSTVDPSAYMQPGVTPSVPVAPADVMAPVTPTPAGTAAAPTTATETPYAAPVDNRPGAFDNSNNFKK